MNEHNYTVKAKCSVKAQRIKNGSKKKSNEDWPERKKNSKLRPEIQHWNQTFSLLFLKNKREKIGKTTKWKKMREKGKEINEKRKTSKKMKQKRHWRIKKDLVGNKAADQSAPTGAEGYGNRKSEKKGWQCSKSQAAGCLKRTMQLQNTP